MQTVITVRDNTEKSDQNQKVTDRTRNSNLNNIFYKTTQANNTNRKFISDTISSNKNITVEQNETLDLMSNTKSKKSLKKIQIIPKKGEKKYIEEKKK